MSTPAAAPTAAPSSTTTHTHPPTGPPDLTQRNKMKRKYTKIQRKYFRTQTLTKDLKLEADEKDAKVQRLQDEINLLIDQIHAADYAHLVPAEDDYFSPDEDATQTTKNGHPPHAQPAQYNGSAETAPPTAPASGDGPSPE